MTTEEYLDAIAKHLHQANLTERQIEVLHHQSSQYITGCVMINASAAVQPVGSVVTVENNAGECEYKGETVNVLLAASGLRYHIKHWEDFKQVPTIVPQRFLFKIIPPIVDGSRRYRKHVKLQETIEATEKDGWSQGTLWHMLVVYAVCPQEFAGLGTQWKEGKRIYYPRTSNTRAGKFLNMFEANEFLLTTSVRKVLLVKPL